MVPSFFCAAFVCFSGVGGQRSPPELSLRSTVDCTRSFGPSASTFALVSFFSRRPLMPARNSPLSFCYACPLSPSPAIRNC